MKTIVLTVFLAVSFFGISQSLIERLGGVETNFTIISKDTLTTSKQYLIKRNQSSMTSEDYSPVALSTREGSQSWHLEFSSSSPLTERRKYRPSERSRFNEYCLELLDKSGRALAKVYMHRSNVTLWESAEGESKFTYSIDMRGLPINLLDETIALRIQLIN